MPLKDGCCPDFGWHHLLDVADTHISFFFPLTKKKKTVVIPSMSLGPECQIEESS
jgi:hypothetical protein